MEHQWNIFGTFLEHQTPRATREWNIWNNFSYNLKINNICIYIEKKKKSKKVFQMFQSVGRVRKKVPKVLPKKGKVLPTDFKELKNVTSFKQWLGKYEDENSPAGDFARDVILDENFPIIQTKEFVGKYLTKNNASDRTMEIFYEVWDRFENRS